MKKKISFVGFSGAELESLQSILTRLMAVWECVFYAEGAPALVALGAGPVDAVVVNTGKGSQTAWNSCTWPPLVNPRPCD